MTIGVLRLALAIGVLAQHISGAVLGYWLTPDWAGASKDFLRGHPWPIGNMSVVGFFIISGFLVQEVASRYHLLTLRGYGVFLLARVARIYPLYWFMLATVLVVLRTTDASVDLDRLFGWILLWPLVLSATLHMRYLFDFTAPLLGPSWTLALDLICYTVGGLVASRPWRILLLLALCLALAPLSSQVFYTSVQANLALFLFGMLLRLQAPRVARLSRHLFVPALVLFAYTWAVPFGLSPGLQYPLFVACFATLLVWAFSRRSRFDLPLSNLTYALYLGQYPVISAMKPLLHADLLAPVWLLITLAGVAAATSALALVESRIERWRRSWLPRARR